MAALRRKIYAALPQHAISQFGGWAARRRAQPLTGIFIRWFLRRYGVNMAEAAESDPRAYASFHVFFTRALKEGARPPPDNPAAITSPVDAAVSACGNIEGRTLIQAKGIGYPASALLGDEDSAALYSKGSFLTLYLRPSDYHRVHAPLAGNLRRIRYIPGRLWPMRPWAVAEIPGLFTRNERLVFEFESRAGAYALAMVGAFLVGGLESVVTGRIHRGRLQPRSWNLETAPRHFERGEEIGRFNFGSTVIVLFPDARASLDASLAAGREVRLNQAVGEVKV